MITIYSKQIGISLIEILISLFITGIVMAAALSFYLADKKRYLQVQQVLETQYDLRLASDLLAHSIRQAGFTPCLGVEQLQTIDTRDADNVLFGIRTESARLQINRMSETFASVIRVRNLSQIELSGQCSLHSQRPVMIADCNHAEVHQISSVNKLQNDCLITLTQPLRFTYFNEIYLGEWLEEQWLIKKNSHGMPALYYQLHRAEELTRHIRSLHAETLLLHAKKLIRVNFSSGNDVTQTLVAAVRGA